MSDAPVDLIRRGARHDCDVSSLATQLTDPTCILRLTRVDPVSAVSCGPIMIQGLPADRVPDGVRSAYQDMSHNVFQPESQIDRFADRIFDHMRIIVL